MVLVICLIGIERKGATNNLRTWRHSERARTYELTTLNVNEELGEGEGLCARRGLRGSFCQNSGLENEVYEDHRGPEVALAVPPSMEAASDGLPSAGYASTPATAEPPPQQPPSAPTPKPPPRSRIVVAVSSDPFVMPDSKASQPQLPTTTKAINKEPTGAFSNWVSEFPGDKEAVSSNAVEGLPYEPYSLAPSNAAVEQAAGVGEDGVGNKAETLDPFAESDRRSADLALQPASARTQLGNEINQKEH